MTELSSEAQAVLDAALPHMAHRYSVAAALRTAVDQLGRELWFYETIMITAEDLLAVAKELEAQ